jgi:hypothetical protein
MGSSSVSYTLTPHVPETHLQFDVFCAVASDPSTSPARLPGRDCSGQVLPPFLPFLQPSIHFTGATYDGLLNEFFRFVTLAESRPQDDLLSCRDSQDHLRHRRASHPRPSPFSASSCLQRLLRILISAPA